MAGGQKWVLSPSAISGQCWLVHLWPSDLYSAVQSTLWWYSLWCLHSEGFSLPGTIGADEWLYKVSDNRHMWPLQMTSHPAADQLPTELFMRNERRRLQACHIWMEIKPKWPKIKTFYCSSAALIMMMVTVLEWMTTLCKGECQSPNKTTPPKNRPTQ